MISYSLSDSSGGVFAIEKSEGILTLAKPLDRELTDTYSIVVVARDGGSPSFSTSVSVQITVTGQF